jgi:hypothetical protein
VYSCISSFQLGELKRCDRSPYDSSAEENAAFTQVESNQYSVMVSTKIKNNVHYCNFALVLFLFPQDT